MRNLAIAVTMFVVSFLGGCHSESQLPVEETTIELTMPTEDLICHVRNASRDLHLRFYYGTSEQPYGTLATFRLIGRGFEITLYNPESPARFYLSLYDMRLQKDDAQPGRSAYRDMESRLRAAPAGCRDGQRG